MTSMISLNLSDKSVYTNTQRRATWAVMIVLTLAAFALRLYRLDYLSLRGDEAFDVLYAAQPLSEIIYQDRFNQIYPPLYHTSLHYWLLIAGRGEFALRWITAVVPGTLLIPLTYALARQLFSQARPGDAAPGRRIGWLAGLLAALNPYLLWWSQDAHFYALLAMFAAAITLLAVRLWNTQGHWRVWWVYTLVTALGFYTHYYTYFPWGAVNLVGLWCTLTRRWPRKLAVRWWLAQVVAVALYAPWLVASFNMVNAYIEPWIEHVSFFEILRRNLTAYSLHLMGEENWAPVMLLIVVAVFLVGSLPWRWRPGRSTDLKTRQVITLLVLIFTPLAVLYLASLQRPLYDEKLTIFVLPLFLVGLARGLVIIWRKTWPMAALITLLLAGPMLLSNYRYFSDTAYAKSPAWREMMSYVHQKAQPGDLLIYNFPESSVLYYNNDKLPIELIPNSARLNADEIRAQLKQVNADYTHVWLVPLVRPWWDTDGTVVTWLDRHADRVDQRFFRGVHVNRYLTPPAWQAAMTLQPVTFAESIRLLGFRLSGGEHETHGLTLSPGDALHLSLYWQADSPSDIPYTVFTHLFGPDGQLYGQWDNPPVRGSYPTSEWSPGEDVVDPYEIPISPDAPPGEYHLLVGLYDPVTGARLPVLDENGQAMGDSIQLNQIIIIQAR
jgi:4-amino-4-deoxy-L-arabinose transferase-like glycosyltransferase